MKSLLHLSDSRAIYEAIELLFLPSSSINVPVIRLDFGNDLHFGLSTSPLNLEAEASFRPPLSSCSVSVDSFPSARFHALVGDSLSLELTGSTRPKKTITGFKDCRASLEGRYRDGPMELGFFLGQTHSKSYAVLSAIDLPSFSASFGGIARGFSNRLEAAYLSREGFFAVAKCDLFAPHEPEIQGGWIFRAPSVAGYLSASTGRRQVTAALLKRTTLGLDIAVKAKYRNRQKVLAQAAIKIIRNATFESTVLSDGTARMRMAFRPVEWIEATVASEASLRNRFQTTNLRWALRISPLHSEAGREQLTSLMSRFSGLVRGE